MFVVSEVAVMGWLVHTVQALWQIDGAWVCEFLLSYSFDRSWLARVRFIVF